MEEKALEVKSLFPNCNLSSHRHCLLNRSIYFLYTLVIPSNLSPAQVSLLSSGTISQILLDTSISCLISMSTDIK